MANRDLIVSGNNHDVVLSVTVISLGGNIADSTG